MVENTDGTPLFRADLGNQTPKIEEDSCRLAMYDKNGVFLGYKSDTFWTPNKRGFKPHPVANTGLDSNLIDNLLYIANSEDLSRDVARVVDGLRINVEKLLPDGTIEDTIARYEVTKNPDGKYIATERNN